MDQEALYGHLCQNLEQISLVGVKPDPYHVLLDHMKKLNNLKALEVHDILIPTTPVNCKNLIKDCLRLKNIEKLLVELESPDHCLPLLEEGFEIITIR
jgi:hypothetical protein